MAGAFGVEACYNLDMTSYNDVAMLDSTHVVVIYVNSVWDGCAKVGVISDNSTITWGAENKFNAAGADVSHMSVAALDSTHFVVTYRDIENSDQGTARIGLVSGSTISSYGSENIFETGSTSYTSVTALDSTHFVVGYRDYPDSGYGKARVGVISGTTITSYGAINTFNAGSTTYISVTALDSTHFVVGYGSANGYARVGLVSGTTISSYGAVNTFSTGTTTRSRVTALDSTHFVVVYLGTAGTRGTARVGLVSGTTISSYGDANHFNEISTTYIHCDTLDSNHFVVVYYDSGDSYGCARQGTVSGTTISSYDTEVVFNSTITQDISVAALSSTDYMVVYQDTHNSVNRYGCSRVWYIPAWSGTILGITSPAKVAGVIGANISKVMGI